MTGHPEIARARRRRLGIGGIDRSSIASITSFSSNAWGITASIAACSDSPALRFMQCSSGTKSTYSTRLASSPANDEAVAGRSALLLTRPTPQREGHVRSRDGLPKPSFERVPSAQDTGEPRVPLRPCQFQYPAGRSKPNTVHLKHLCDILF